MSVRPAWPSFSRSPLAVSSTTSVASGSVTVELKAAPMQRYSFSPPVTPGTLCWAGKYG
jgi:hypothetical protein